MKDDQAEQTPTAMRCKPKKCRDQVEPCLSAVEDPETTQDRGQAEQDDSPGSRDTQNTRQSHTIPWAVARYVSIPPKNSHFPILTKQYLGRHQIESQAEQHGSEDRMFEEGQAEQCHILQGGADWTLPLQSL